MSKKRSHENVEGPTTAKRVNSECDNWLWRIVTDHLDIFDGHILPKLDGNEVKFLYDVNTESRAAIKRSSARLPNAFKIRELNTNSTLSWALEKCRENSSFCAQMALNGKLESLKFLRENGCPWDETTCSSAAKNGHLECLKYARANGCPWDETTCHNAAENSQLECLKYAIRNGCGGRTCSWAAESGRLECLKYARENGCPWDEDTCSRAAKNGHIECLKYARENGCPGSAKYAHHLLPARKRE